MVPAAGRAIMEPLTPIARKFHYERMVVMIELLFVVCLSADPTQCQERSLVFTDITETTCVIGAQPELAKWSEAHPRYDIRRWTCRHVRSAEHAI
jgi:hypothetical protein